MGNDRREKFVTLAERRTTNTIKQIRLIGNLSNRGNYVYSEKDVAKIVSVLNNEIKMMRERFMQEGARDKVEFKL